MGLFYLETAMEVLPLLQPVGGSFMAGEGGLAEGPPCQTSWSARRIPKHEACHARMPLRNSDTICTQVQTKKHSSTSLPLLSASMQHSTYQTACKAVFLRRSRSSGVLTAQYSLNHQDILQSCGSPSIHRPFRNQKSSSVGHATFKASPPSQGPGTGKKGGHG